MMPSMGLFLVSLRRRGPSYDATLAVESQSGWSEHAAYMEELVDRGFVLLGGPLGDEERVVLVVEADTLDDVRRTLAADPWHASHLVVDAVDPWTIRLDGTGRRGRHSG
jgi:uncharacterized protein YciI